MYHTAWHTKQLPRNSLHRQRGITLIELLLTIAIASLIMAGMAGVVGQVLQVENTVRERNELTQQARFAMQRMLAAVRGTRRLMVPMADNPNTDWLESVREETVPASLPEGSSSKASAVLAVTLGSDVDLDGDGWADANNDKDFLDLNNSGVRDAGEPERIDEDLSNDLTLDGESGLVNIDDDGDGTTIDGSTNDDDEDGSTDEDDIDGIDLDADGSVDEDPGSDMSGDSAPGILGVDDDHDGLIDEGHQFDDDEDGVKDEDGFEPVVYYLSGADLIERWPSLTDTNVDGFINGLDYTESVIASNVTKFRLERVSQGSLRSVQVDITLELTGNSGEIISLNTRVRVRGGS